MNDEIIKATALAFGLPVHTVTTIINKFPRSFERRLEKESKKLNN